MTISYVAEVLGSSGMPIALIPGGGIPSSRAFPHLEDALIGRHRLVLVDRPGTGRAAALGEASLASGAAAYAQVLQELDAGPALVVGQSLGGAVAVQLAIDYPELVSGLVLIDPTVFNSPRAMRMIRPMAKLMLGPAGLPVVGPSYERFLTRRGGERTDDVGRASLEVSIEHRGLYVTSKAIDTLAADGAALTPRLRRLPVPVVLLTADRKPTHPYRRAHEEMVEALGGRIVTWPGAVHGEHLREPQKVVDLVRAILNEIGRTSGFGDPRRSRSRPRTDLGA